jgi:hypothetical protein
LPPSGWSTNKPGSARGGQAGVAGMGLLRAMNSENWVAATAGSQRRIATAEVVTEPNTCSAVKTKMAMISTSGTPQSAAIIRKIAAAAAVARWLATTIRRAPQCSAMKPNTSAPPSPATRFACPDQLA